MSGDYTRFTFDPINGFSGVLKQQGRVSLDADFNEFEEILDRRDRAEMFDVVGQAVVPTTTPNGFQILLDASGNITIGRGRAYVDGIQVECFGDLSDPTKAELDLNLGGVHGPDAVGLPYIAQPFYYSTPAYPIPSTTTGTVDLVYLDVWQREVTVYEDPALLDPALEGRDTATRVQTAWQVRVLPNVGMATCADQSTEWTSTIAPSTARLSNSVGPAPTPPGPCIVNPAGGYTGLENRLYRVEIHQTGTIGGSPRAVFKWSRDDASLVAGVISITQSGTDSVITVDSTGRDAWKQFSVNDTIELLDDFVEFSMRQTNIGGETATIKNVNEATGEITVDKDLSTFTIVAARHPRIKRWDVANVGDSALVDAKNGTLPLEYGISVTFGANDSDTLHAGDYWVFAARTADGSIEPVVDQPPRGNLHHFAKLALIQAGAAQPLSDCRVFWPPAPAAASTCCDCTVCVTAKSHASGELTINMAVEQVVAAGGGTVCIGLGTFILHKPVNITGALSVRVHGEGAKTVILWRGEGPAFAVNRSIDLILEEFTLVTVRNGAVTASAIEITNCAAVELDRLVVVEDIIGLLDLLENQATKRPIGAAVALDGLVAEMLIDHSLLAGGSGVAARGLLEQKGIGYLVLADFRLMNNVLVGGAYGVQLAAQQQFFYEAALTTGTSGVLFIGQTLLEHNWVLGGQTAGIHVGGVSAPGAITIDGNQISVAGAGILVGASGAIVSGNNITGLRTAGRTTMSVGIDLVAGESSVLADCRLLSNRIRQFRDQGILIDTYADAVMIKHNVIRACTTGIATQSGLTVTNLSVANNTIDGMSVAGEQARQDLVGVLLVQVSDAAVVDNVVRNVGQAPTDTSSAIRAGIWLASCGSVRVAGNEVSQIGETDADAITAGIAATAPFSDIDVVDNRVGITANAVVNTPWLSLRITGTAPTSFGFAQLLAVAAKAGSRGALGVRGNVLDAPRGDGAAAANITCPGPCVFADNRCSSSNTPLLASVSLDVDTLLMSSNYVIGGQPSVSAQIGSVVVGGTEPVATVVGNVTDGKIEVNSRALQAPWDSLNLLHY